MCDTLHCHCLATCGIMHCLASTLQPDMCRTNADQPIPSDGWGDRHPLDTRRFSATQKLGGLSPSEDSSIGLAAMTAERPGLCV